MLITISYHLAHFLVLLAHEFVDIYDGFPVLHGHSVGLLCYVVSVLRIPGDNAIWSEKRPTLGISHYKCVC